MAIQNSIQKAQAEGRKSRQAVVNYLLECLTDPANPTTAAQIEEFRWTSFYFPYLEDAIDKVERMFDGEEELRRAIMLAAVYDLIERLVR